MAHVRYYYCQKCGSVYNKNSIHVITTKEVHFWLDGKPTEYFFDFACPYCGASTNFDEAEFCEGCDEPFRPDQLEDGLCEECRKLRE